MMNVTLIKRNTKRDGESRREKKGEEGERTETDLEQTDLLILRVYLVHERL
jgi:hypothetical protein